MSSAHVCTLFEGDYHYGLGALVNSLFSSGFVGTLWVGYRGSLPHWTNQLVVVREDVEYLLLDRVTLVFVELETSTHFTMYKPDFMLQLLQTRCPDATLLFYFDPDIIVKARWSYFENWASHGVALCEDVNSPLSRTAPLRKDWAAYFATHGIELCPQDDLYVNGGFIGVSPKTFGFLREWKNIQDLIRVDLPAIRELKTLDRSHRFLKMDQDALNIAKDTTAVPISAANKEHMDFCPGGSVMAHAIGPQKPWRKNFLRCLFATGARPTAADKLYFKSVLAPVDVYKQQKRRYKLRKMNLVIATALSRVFAN